MNRIRKDDLVQVISGKDKGRTGKVIRVYPSEQAISIEGVGIVKRHQKATQAGAPAGIVERNSKINWSKVMLIDPKTKKPTRVRFQFKDDKKLRVAKSGQEIASQKTA